jgi:hypothetical protein
MSHQLWMKYGSTQAITKSPFIIGFQWMASLMMLGQKIIVAKESTIENKLVFENRQSLIIDLREEAYPGPEAMVLHGPGNFCEIWN